MVGKFRTNTLRHTLHALCVLVLMMPATTVGATEAAWARVASGGYTILLSHAATAGTGDPVGFDIGECATQDNLSGRGRQQARRRGTRFAARAVPIAAIYTSEWCRAKETAELAFGSYDSRTHPALNLLGAGGADEEARIAAMMELINGFAGPGNQILITHPENIGALTGSEPREGEAVIVAPAPEGEERPEVVGRILLD